MNKIAVWLDYRTATLVTFENGVASTRSVESGIENQVRIEGEGSNSSRFGESEFSNNENKENNRHANEVNSYFKNLSQLLKEYNEIHLLGPTNAKNQLRNVLKSDKSFENTKIEIKSADKLTPNQLIAFAKEQLFQ